jgi:hypothetical protein
VTQQETPEQRAMNQWRRNLDDVWYRYLHLLTDEELCWIVARYRREIGKTPEDAVKLVTLLREDLRQREAAERKRRYDALDARFQRLGLGKRRFV